MPFLLKETDIVLKLFTQTLLENQQPTLFKAGPPHPETQLPQIEWRGMTIDKDLFRGVCGIIYGSKQVPDREFRDRIIPKLQDYLTPSPIFQRLNDPNIVVTAAHQGTTPYTHIWNVVRCLQTRGLGPEMAGLVRLSAIYHDTGKAISSGLSSTQAREIMASFGNTKHSHPNHAEISTLVARELLDTPFASICMDWLTPSGSQLSGREIFLQLLLNHHYFEDIRPIMTALMSTSSDPTEAPLVQELKNYTAQEWQMVLTIFTFMRADLGSNVNYHQYWKPNLRLLSQLLELAPPKMLGQLPPDQQYLLFRTGVITRK